MSKDKLEKIFYKAAQCKDETCTINKKGIEYIFKPDLGLKDEVTKKAIFGYEVQPNLCDCIIKKDQLILLEIKCGKVTKSILKEIKKQLENVAKILKYISVDFHQVKFIYKSLDNIKLRQEIAKIQIDKKTLKGLKYENKALEI